MKAKQDNNSLNSQGDMELSAIKAIELAAAARSDVISLAQGIPSFRMPEVVTDFVQEKISQGLCDRYSLTNGLPELREEIALSLREDNLHYDPETEILVTTGSIEALTATLLGITKPGDEVIIPSPSYVSYSACIKLAGCTPCYVPLNEERRFDLDIRQIEESINRKTKVIFYCNPNNPTGTVYSDLMTQALVDLALNHDLYILTDEVYKDFYYTSRKHCSPAFIEKARGRVIRVFSFSKAYAMTGWRVGYLHSDKKNVGKILGYHDAMVTCAPVASQYAALGALRYGQDSIVEFREEYKKRREILIDALDSLSHVLDYQTPEAAYFVFPRVKDVATLSRDSKKLAYDILDKAKLALVPGVAFGPTGESHLRISFGRETDHVIKGMERLHDYFTHKPRAERQESSDTKNVFTNTSYVSLSIRIRRKFIAIFLGWFAKRYISKIQPTIIGVCGARGKTVCKRTLSQFFAPIVSVRSNPFSYNTAIGLPLSVLALDVPRTIWQKLTFPFRVIQQTFFAKSNPDYLILEYGIGSVREAKELLKIAKPDWLIATHLDPHGLNMEPNQMLNGFVHTFKQVEDSQILYYEERQPDGQLNQLAPTNAVIISRDNSTKSSIVTEKGCYELSSPVVGKSFALAYQTAVQLAERLNMSREQIEQGLETHSDK